MQGRHILLDSAAMGRKMNLWCYGHFGPPILVFPSAAGMAHEWDAQGMIEVLTPLLAAGKMKLYCPESNVGEAWTRKEGSLAWRMSRHRAYEAFINDELVPWMRADCRWAEAPIIATGCSLGATYAANAALKRPDLFKRALCMSGRYLATALTGGENNSDLYFNNPLAYVPGLDGGHLDFVRQNTHLTLVCGQGMWEEGCIEETIALGLLLQKKGIPSITDIWGQDSRHDWDWWRKQVVYHLGRMLG